MPRFRLSDRALNDPTHVLASLDFDDLTSALRAFRTWTESAKRSGGDIRLQGPGCDLRRVYLAGSE